MELCQILSFRSHWRNGRWSRMLCDRLGTLSTALAAGCECWRWRPLKNIVLRLVAYEIALALPRVVYREARNAKGFHCLRQVEISSV